LENGMLRALKRAAAALSALMLCIGGPAVFAQAGGQSAPGEEVRFASDPGIMLAGTLETPRGVGAGPFPVVVLISGTGPWTRGGWINIRARLLASGIAILQYDKRGLGQSTGAFVDTIPAMERDVAAAVAFLRTRRDIDPRRIALVGTSQGGRLTSFAVTTSKGARRAVAPNPGARRSWSRAWWRSSSMPFAQSTWSGASAPALGGSAPSTSPFQPRPPRPPVARSSRAASSRA
jgi:acetyl esterase/lipase